MSFIVSVSGPRIKAGFTRETATEAIDKANELLRDGVVTIVDPHGHSYLRDQFSELKERWADRSLGGSQIE